MGGVGVKQTINCLLLVAILCLLSAVVLVLDIVGIFCYLFDHFPTST